MNKLKRWFNEKVLGKNPTIDDLRKQLKHCVKFSREWKKKSDRPMWRNRFQDSNYSFNYLLFCTTIAELDRLYREKWKKK